MDITHDTYVNGVLVERRNDTTRTVTTYENGAVVSVEDYNAEENTQADARALAQTVVTNESDLISKATQAITNNVAYLDKATTTTAQDKAQIRALSRQVNALIRLVTRNLDDVGGT